MVQQLEHDEDAEVPINIGRNIYIYTRIHRSIYIYELEKRVQQHDEDAEVPVNIGIQRMQYQARLAAGACRA